MNPLIDRRKSTPEDGDARVKSFIIGTICLIALMVVTTICYCTISGLEIPDQLDRLATFVLGGIMTMLVKTGVDKFLPQKPLEVVAPPNEPLEVTAVEAAPDEAPQDDGQAMKPKRKIVK